MGLFDQVLSAVQDPNRQASMGQLGQILSTAQQLGQANNTDSNTMQQAASVLGGFVRSSLKDTRATQGPAAAEALVQQGATDGTGVLPKLFNAGQQQQLVQVLSQKTGLNAGQVQAMLPMLIPLVMRLLNQGSTKASPQPEGSAGASNNVLSAFLDADGDGDVDMGDMLGMAGTFM
ncbi:MAG: DUF937 domain-containing protein [Cyanobacteria bacterium P01_F01_bin.4]